MFEKGSVVLVSDFARRGFFRGDEFLGTAAPRVPCHRGILKIKNQRDSTPFLIIGFTYWWLGEYKPGTNDTPGVTTSAEKKLIYCLTPLKTQRYQLFYATEDELKALPEQMRLL